MRRRPIESLRVAAVLIGLIVFLQSPIALEFLTDTVTDPTCGRPWTVKQELKTQRDDQNRIDYEPRCHEGNSGLAPILIGARIDEKAIK